MRQERFFDMHVDITVAPNRCRWNKGRGYYLVDGYK